MNTDVIATSATQGHTVQVNCINYAATAHTVNLAPVC